MKAMLGINGHKKRGGKKRRSNREESDHLPLNA